MKYRTQTILGILVIVLAMVTYIANAQDGAITPEPLSSNFTDALSEVSQGRSVILYETNEGGVSNFSILNLSTIERNRFPVALEALIPFQSDQQQVTTEILDIELDSLVGAIYLIQGPPLVFEQPPRQNTLSRIDLATQQKESLYSGQEMFDFTPSADMQHAVISSFQGTFGQSLQQFCVLNMRSFECQPLALETAYRFGDWIDPETFVLVGADSTLLVVNASTLTTRSVTELELWTIHALTHIPNTQKLLMTASAKAASLETTHFLVYDPDTLQLSELAYRPPGSTPDQIQDYAQIHQLQFSADGQYLLFSGGRRRNAIVEFDSGQLIGEITANTVHWLPDGAGVIFAHRINDNLLQVADFTLAEGQTRVLLETSASIAILAP